nr:uncharacterized protein LOC128679228 isoform X2 [Plodia interpunctella]
MMLSFKNTLIICIYFDVIFSKRIQRDDNAVDEAVGATGTIANNDGEAIGGEFQSDGADNKNEEKRVYGADIENSGIKNPDVFKEDGKADLGDYIDLVEEISKYLENMPHAQELGALAQQQDKTISQKDAEWLTKFGIFYQKLTKGVEGNVDTDDGDNKKVVENVMNILSQTQQQLSYINEHLEDKNLDKVQKDAKNIVETAKLSLMYLNGFKKLVKIPALLVTSTIRIIRTVVNLITARKLKSEEIWGEGRRLVKALDIDENDEGIRTLSSKVSPTNMNFVKALLTILTITITQLVNPAPLSLKLKNFIESDANTLPRRHSLVEYFIDPSSYDSIIESRVQAAMNKIEQASCIRFIQLTSADSRDSERDLILINNPSRIRECYHARENVPFQRTVRIVLGYDCLQDRDILHALMHGLWFNDEVAHPQRDKYIRVMWDDILPDYTKLFQTVHTKHLMDNPVEFDPMSIMQFHDRQFSRTGRPTIVPLIPGMTISPSDDLSALDKLKLRMAFGQACTINKLAHVMDSCKLAMKEGDDRGNGTADGNKEFVEKIGTDGDNIEDPDDIAGDIVDDKADENLDDIVKY